jgi:GntR family transcriptional regulator
MLRLGLEPGSKVLSFEKRLPTVREQRALDLRKHNPVFHAHRLRFLQDAPIGVQHLTLPVSVAPDLRVHDLETVSFYALLRERGLPLASATQTIESVGSDAVPEINDQLTDGRASSFLRIERRSFATDGTPLELLISWFRGDKYAYEMNLSGSGE